MSKQKGLGRGLSALFSEENTKEEVNDISPGISEVDIILVEPNKSQPRKTFDSQSLSELSESIKEFGIIQPLLVSKKDEGYEIIAGERRWRAAKLAGLKKIPIVIKEYSDLESLEVSLIENLQREDLNPIEEAQSYKRLTDEFGLKQEEIALRIGKSRSTITNSMRILNLDKEVQALVANNKISSGHARAILMMDTDMQHEIAEKIINEGLSVRQTETLVKKLSEEKKATRQSMTEYFSNNDFYYKNIENNLKNLLGTKVKLNNGKTKGKIEIEYYSDDDLDRIIYTLKKLEV